MTPESITVYLSIGVLVSAVFTKFWAEDGNSKVPSALIAFTFFCAAFVWPVIVVGLAFIWFGELLRKLLRIKP